MHPESADQYDDPAVTVAERILADPGVMRRRLDADLERVALAGREPVRVDPALPAEELVAAVRAAADRIGFRTPVAAAAAARRRRAELPFGERQSGELIEAYHASAAKTVAGGEVVRDLSRPDAGIDLVFQRVGQEPNATRVRQETVVRVTSDGTAYLDNHGWPTVAPDQPAMEFDGAATGYLDELLQGLRAAAEAYHSAGGPDDAAHRVAADLFEQAMLMALGSQVAQRRDGALPRGRLAPYQEEVFALVTRAPLLLVEYLEGVFDLAERGDAASWQVGCVRRSAADALFGDFLGSAAFEVVTAESLAELDRTLAGVADELVAAGEPLAPPPAGLPGGQEWWLPRR